MVHPLVDQLIQLNKDKPTLETFLCEVSTGISVEAIAVFSLLVSGTVMLTGM